jgi:serine/threonine protein kinase
VTADAREAGARSASHPRSPLAGELDDSDLPRTLDRYVLLRRLATGGMAELFLAKQSGLEGFEKVVVLKQILPHLAADEEFVTMFLDEARIAAKLSHPNIAQIYDLGRAENTYYIAMEFVSGRNIQHLMLKQEQRGGRVPVEHACRITAGVCDGLHYAHSRKDYDGTPLSIVHRDISPQNILVSFAGGVKVVDFGIAKASTQLAQTRAGVLKGKYAYMSPEQVKGAKIDHRSDIFALGLVMYEMLTGARAFERDTSLKTLKAIVQEKPLNPRELNPDIPMEVVKLMSRALETNPEKRYKTAQEMQLAIEDYLEASPKKSNNVRISRYMYDLFDDELKSADGTMVVEGVGEVIIPTSDHNRNKRPEPIDDEIDNKTLSAALLPDGNVIVTSPKAPGERDPRDRAADVAAEPPPAASEVDGEEAHSHSGFDGDGDDGKTIPAYDLEQYEALRAASARKEPVAPVEEEDDFAEGKTTAAAPAFPAQSVRSMPEGVESELIMPSSQVSGEAEALREDEAPTQLKTALVPPLEGPKKLTTAEQDAQAAALLRKVDAMASSLSNDAAPVAPGPVESPAPPKSAASIRGGKPQLVPGLVQSSPMPAAAQSSSQVSNPRTAAASTQIVVGRRSDSRVEHTPATRGGAGSLKPGAESKTPPLPFAVKAALAAMAGMMLLSLIGLVAIFYVFPSSSNANTGPVETGVLTIDTVPAGALVFIDGDKNNPALTPAQVDVSVGVAHTLDIELAGHQQQQTRIELPRGTHEKSIRIQMAPLPP